jgi:hypothetical protein
MSVNMLDSSMMKTRETKGIPLNTLSWWFNTHGSGRQREQRRNGIYSTVYRAMKSCRSKRFYFIEFVRESPGTETKCYTHTWLIVCTS